MAQAASGRPLPPGLDLLWGRRNRGRRGPRPGLSAEAILEAAIRVADAEGLEAVSMARVAAELGFTPMSLYRYVASKEELLQLMFDGSALGAEHLVIEGDNWRSRLRNWAIIQRDMLDRHPWITQMPMAAPRSRRTRCTSSSAASRRWTTPAWPIPTSSRSSACSAPTPSAKDGWPPTPCGQPRPP